MNAHNPKTHICGYPPCSQEFTPTTMQTSLANRGFRTYCIPNHGTLARRDRKSNPNPTPPTHPNPEPEPEPLPITPNFVPWGAHPNSILSFPL